MRGLSGRIVGQLTIASAEIKSEGRQRWVMSERYYSSAASASSDTPSCMTDTLRRFAAIAALILIASLPKAATPQRWPGSFNCQWNVITQSRQTTTAGTIGSLGNQPSINETGYVAFIGHIVRGTTPVGDAFWVSNGMSAATQLNTVPRWCWFSNLLHEKNRTGRHGCLLPL